MQGIRIVTCLIALTIAFPTLAGDPRVTVTLTEAADAKSTFSGDEYCELQVEISNQAWGTLHYLWLTIEAWDDRGQKIRGYAFGDIVENEVGHDNVAVPVGTTILVNKAELTTKCQWLDRVKGTLGNDDCAIRLMPEAIDCADVVVLTSRLSGVTVE